VVVVVVVMGDTVIVTWQDFKRLFSPAAPHFHCRPDHSVRTGNGKYYVFFSLSLGRNNE
jgi:hypothetical protein